MLLFALAHLVSGIFARLRVTGARMTALTFRCLFELRTSATFNIADTFAAHAFGSKILPPKSAMKEEQGQSRDALLCKASNRLLCVQWSVVIRDIAGTHAMQC